MDKNYIKIIIKDSIKTILDNTSSANKIKSIKNKHIKKPHFIPIKYRVFGGLLQSVNIQFGNFIEELINNIALREKGIELLEEYSGKKRVCLHINNNTDSIIDSYITKRQETIINVKEEFNNLLSDIIIGQNSTDTKVEHVNDIDLLFKKNDIYYYIELKYNDDHDTGKYIDINRKFIKTYAGIVKTLGINDVNKIKPILHYFTPKTMKGNIFIPEETNIYRGKRLFEEFLSIQYNELSDILSNISEDKEIIEIFDSLYNKIMKE